ncbi:probable cytochrome P450 9f2 [Sitodiplosis mosellana]|uniref:probable cytochrome P450 9f2 n=1 Tax=Sitodiplosis mosellana TaxID=263140 RepID=UPI00244510AF|nr:probable cytochrome P450 9f2 [Sitodiplosis mosellana]
MLSNSMFYALVGVTVLYAFYKWATANQNYFMRRNMKHLKPTFLIGNTLKFNAKRTNPVKWLNSVYYKYPNEKVIGFFDMRKPVYFVRDVDFLRQIAIKYFDHFEDRTSLVSPKSDTLIGNSLLSLTGKKWHDMRSTLSPSFTSSKMQQMFELVVECADDMAKYFIEESMQNKPIRWEMKRLFARYTNDIIASCSFGLKVDSLRDPKNEFFTVACRLLSSRRNTIETLKLLLIRAFPDLMCALNIEVFRSDIKLFFKSMVLDTMEEREVKNIVRPDMINIMMQVRSGKLKHDHDESNDNDTGFATVEESNIGRRQVNRTWTDDEIIAQCFLFFLAGFDTISTSLSFMAYELALNQDIQQKLYEEIREVNESLNGGRLTYDTLPKMKYFDQVISETLRKWPSIFTTSRKCTKDFEFELDGKKILIERGQEVRFPIYSIHHDPEIYENPEQFDPERFSGENKHKIKPGSYIPFGIGPRNCIGSRFALMEMKALLFYLLLNFNIQPYDETEIPLKIGRSTISWNIKNGIHLEFKPRA